MRELKRTGIPNSHVHILVAERPGLPLGYLQWKYPNVDSLALFIGPNATTAPFSLV
jgi:hypothetical protein